MAITTYAELKTAIASWLHRDDLTSIIPDFITLAESRLNRETKLIQQETSATVTLTSGLDYASLPTGFIKMLEFYYTADLFIPTLIPFSRMEEIRSFSTATGQPFYYSISDKFYFDVIADQTYSLTCRYRKKWDIASDSTNALLTNYPDAYLFASLAEAAPYLKNDTRVAIWEAKAQKSINDSNQIAARQRTAELITDLPPTRSRADIYRGR